MEHETLSKLYLELDQVVPAGTKTRRILELEDQASELEHSLADAMEQIAALQGASEAREDRMAEVEAEAYVYKMASDADRATIAALRDGKPAPVFCAWCLKQTGESGQVDRNHAETCELSPLAQARATVVELESMLNEISASLVNGPDIGPELPRAVKAELGRLQGELDILGAAGTFIGSMNDGLCPTERETAQVDEPELDRDELDGG